MWVVGHAGLPPQLPVLPAQSGELSSSIRTLPGCGWLLSADKGYLIMLAALSTSTSTTSPGRAQPTITSLLWWIITIQTTLLVTGLVYPILLTWLYLLCVTI